jgi:hypothetical protein
MEKQNDLYKWVDMMTTCFRSATLQECENWAAKQLERGWVRNGNTLSHPNHGQVLYLMPSSQPCYYGEANYEKKLFDVIASQKPILANVTIIAHRNVLHKSPFWEQKPLPFNKNFKKEINEK